MIKGTAFRSLDPQQSAPRGRPVAGTARNPFQFGQDTLGSLDLTKHSDALEAEGRLEKIKKGVQAAGSFISNPVAQQLLAQLGVAATGREPNSAGHILNQFVLEGAEGDINSANFNALMAGEELPYPHADSPELRQAVVEAKTAQATLRYYRAGAEKAEYDVEFLKQFSPTERAEIERRINSERTTIHKLTTEKLELQNTAQKIANHYALNPQIAETEVAPGITFTQEMTLANNFERRLGRVGDERVRLSEAATDRARQAVAGLVPQVLNRFDKKVDRELPLDDVLQFVKSVNIKKDYHSAEELEKEMEAHIRSYARQNVDLFNNLEDATEAYENFWDTSDEYRSLIATMAQEAGLQLSLDATYQRINDVIPKTKKDS